MEEDYKFCYECRKVIKLPDGSYNELEKKLEKEDMDNRSSTICPECYKENHPKFFENWRLQEYITFYDLYGRKDNKENK